MQGLSVILRGPLALLPFHQAASCWPLNSFESQRNNDPLNCHDNQQHTAANMPWAPRRQLASFDWQIGLHPFTWPCVIPLEMPMYSAQDKHKRTNNPRNASQAKLGMLIAGAKKHKRERKRRKKRREWERKRNEKRCAELMPKEKRCSESVLIFSWRLWVCEWCHPN